MGEASDIEGTLERVQIDEQSAPGKPLQSHLV